jgi:phosphatidate cytidylyltransferase
MWFCMTLKRGRLNYQFGKFAFTLLFSLYVGFTVTALMVHVQLAFFWVLFCAMLPAINDAFAYFSGMTFGRTSLIKLSPNKTLEGFIGGAVFTQVYLVYFTNTYFKKEDFVCITYEIPFEPCKPITCFSTPEYVFENCFELFGFKFSRALVLCMIFGLFVSTVAPFAGFFASGMKRAYELKDFAKTLPGHGGFLDRFDCNMFSLCFSFVLLKTLYHDVIASD